MNERAEEIRKALLIAVTCAERTCIAGRRQERSLLTEHFQVVIGCLERVLTFSELQPYQDVLLGNFELIMTAFSDEDYVLFVDYIEELLIKPLQEIITGLVVEMTPPDTGDERYVLEYTPAGTVTLAKKVDGKNIYLHSNTSPTNEGKILARKWKRDGVRKYVFAGLGLGYAMGELALINEAEVYVYEEDKKMIQLAQTYSDNRMVREGKEIHIVHDPGYAEFAKEAIRAEQEEVDPVTGVKPTQVNLYYPSIASIEDEKLRERMKKIYLRKDNSERWMNALLRNISYNTMQVKKYGEELRDVFEKKRVYIIAGGPSLDKNVHLLKERNADEIVLTVGTSLKKCLKDEIQPDYVITTDPKPGCMFQFEGIMDCDVPMILLSTAYEKVVSQYAGEKYLIFQEGLDVAERLAKEKNQSLFQSGSSVTTTAIDFCIQMGASEIVFLGLDLANTGGKSHHSGTAEQRDTTNENSFMVEDIYGDLVPTTVPFNEYRLWVEERIQEAKKQGSGTRFIDATEGGAKVAGTEIMTLAEILGK